MDPINWLDAAHGTDKAELERVALPAYLPRCRWFSGKSRSIVRVGIRDWVQPPEGGAWALLFLSVGYAEGAPEEYLLPLARAQGEAAARVRLEAPAAIVAETAGDPRDGGAAILFEAVHDAGFRARILKWIATGGAWPGRAGSLRAHPAPGAFQDRMPDAADTSAVLKAEQSNTSIIFPAGYFVKFLRRLEGGENPELEILRFLAGHTGFRNAPPYLGSLEYVSAAASPGPDRSPGNIHDTYTVAIAEGLVGHRSIAWTEALALAGGYMRRLLENRGPLPAQADAQPARPIDAAAYLGPDDASSAFARLLGTRTAEMHAALASRPDLPAFAPEAFTLEYQLALHEGIRRQVDVIYALLSQAMPRLPAGTAALARKIEGNRARVMDAFGGLLQGLIPAVKTRVHGDYHLGQVLCTETDVVILDFEGEPARPVPERKLKRSPWKDVAGMLRSFHYAAYSAADSAWPDAAALPERERQALEPWIEAWPDWMASAFLEAYLRAAGNAAFVPAARDRETLLRVHLMEKAVYELGYELNNRPDWAHIPMLGILRLL